MTVTVLVVDGEPDTESLFRQQFRRELRQNQFTLEFALSGKVALEMLAGLDADSAILLVSDIDKPGMSGLDLLRTAKTRWPNLTAFMVSDYGDAETRAAAFARGASKFMTTPLDFPQLKQDIAAAIAEIPGGG